MSTKAVYGLLLTILLPLAAYFSLKITSEGAVVMPKHYLPDSVVAATKNGKKFSDTAWHTVPDFRFTNQYNNVVTWDSLKDQIVVANFFFTHCPTICPRMTLNMKLLQDSIKSNDKVGNREARFIHFLSFSIDPERDSAHALKKWADRFQINPLNWDLLTGPKKEIYDLSINDMKLMAQDGGPVDSNFIHTDYFVLIDRNRNVRGYYHGLNDDDIRRLSRDIVLLALEKDPKKKSVFSGQLELLAIIFTIAAIAVILLVIYMKKDRKGKWALS